MKTNTQNKILHLIQNNPQIAAKEIIDHLELSKQAIYKHLTVLIDQKKIYKSGKPPQVFYSIKTQDQISAKKYTIKTDVIKFINREFIDIIPTGEIKKGWPAFLNWCIKRNQPVETASAKYVEIIKKYDSWKKDDLLDGQQKLKNTFKHVYLDKIFYLDFYSIEHFGKTTLGKNLLYAKQSQNKSLVKQLVQTIRPTIAKIIRNYKIEAVGFIPPTVKREIQFMKELNRHLNLKLPQIDIIKIKTPITIPQKTLSKLEDRIENAKHTFVVNKKTSYSNILLIDDAVGSGATLNEVANQIKLKNIATNKIIGLAITGSLKGFDIISEV